MTKTRRSVAAHVGRLLTVMVIASLALGVPMVVPDAQLPQAAAATINFGGVQASVSNQTSYTGVTYDTGNKTATFSGQTTDPATAAGGCTRYSPSANTFVSAGANAIVSHGNDVANCPGAVNLSKQSAVQVTPNNVTTVNDGDVFLLAKVTHYNNPINGNHPKYYQGNVNIRFPGFTGNNTVSFTYQLAETPNTATVCEQSPAELNPWSNNQAGTPNANGCADWISFISQVSSTTLLKDGITYKLQLEGFDQSAQCSATLDPSGTGQTFWTMEKATTSACLYASFKQVRSLTIVKKVLTADGSVAPAKTFSFSTTSSVRSGEWDNKTFTLSGGQSYGPKELLQDQQVTVTEAPPGDKWSVKDIQCVDGENKSVDITKDLTNGKFTLKVGAPASDKAAPVTCTYTNEYKPDAQLTLVKKVDGGTATPANWTLTATGSGASASVISGASGSAGVTKQKVKAGTYVLSETGPVGYVQQGAWACKNDAGAAVAVTDGNKVTLVDNASVTCEVTNRFQKGDLKITKTVKGPEGGYVGTGKPFSGTYKCGSGAEVPFQVGPGAGNEVTVTGIPAGTSCTVTETAPSGSTNLKDTSYTWVSTAYAPAQTVVIPDQGSATVAITNEYKQNFGSLQLNKVVTPRDGTPATGYTGGDNRAFAIGYDCKIGNTTVKSGSEQVSVAGSKTVTGIPATSVCTVTETGPSGQNGDFADASYAWDGNTISPPATITDNATQKVTVTNYFTKLTGSLTIEKKIVGDGYTGGAAKEFKVDWKCSDSEKGTAELANGGSETIKVPANLACTVTEQSPTGNLAAGYEWAAPTYEGLTNGTVTTTAGQSATVTVTNRTNPTYGNLSVTKKVTGETAGVLNGSTFPVTVTCNAPAQGESANYAHTFDLVPGVPQSTPQLQIGTACTVSEGALPALIDASYAWGPKPADQQVTIDTKDQTAAVTVTNTVTRVYAKPAIVKAVTAKDGLNGSNVTFNGTWKCTYGGSEVATGQWSVIGTGSASLTATDGSLDTIPVTAACSATENTVTTPPSGTDSSYVWGAPSIDGPVTLTPSGGTITVTNPILRVTGQFTVGKTVVGGAAGSAYQDTAFTFHYVCTPQSGETVSGDLTAKAGQTAQLPAGTTIPLGSTCTVEETGKANPIDPYTWDSVTYSGTGVTTSGTKATFKVSDANTPIAVTVTNTTSAKTVDVTVKKKVSGQTAGLKPGTTFAISLTCTVPGSQAPQTFGPQQVSDGGSATIAVPLGSSCVATEALPAAGTLVDGSYAWEAPTYDPSSSVVVSEPTTFTVTNPITRVYSGPNSLKITKILTDPDSVVAADHAYAGTWSCTYGNDPAVTGTWSRDGAGEATVSGFPTNGVLIGSSCTVSENALSNPAAANGDPSYTWGAPAYGAATVEAGAVTTMTVTNTVNHATGALKITKKLDGETAGYAATGTPFAIDYSCRFKDGGPERTGTVNLGPGGTATVEGISNGWTCSATERASSLTSDLLVNASYAWGSPASSDPVTISAGGDAPTITVTNTITRAYGALAIDKAYGTNADAITAQAAFSGTYQCTYTEGTTTSTYSGTWKRDGAGSATLTADAGMPAPDQLPVTSSCTVTEIAPTGGLVDGSWAWTEPHVSQPAPITAQGTSKAVVTNSPTRVYSEVKVAKAFDGDAAKALKPDAKVTGTWQCTHDGTRPEDNQNGTWELPAAGGTASLSTSVPTGAACTVTENTPVAGLLVDSSYAWNTPTYDPAGGKVTTVAGAPQTVTITNSVHRQYGELEITKVIDLPDGVQPASDLGFSGTYTCTHPGDDPQTGTWALSYPSKASIPGILVGSSCEITETAPAGGAAATDPSYVFTGQHVISGQPATVALGEKATITVTNKTERITTSLSIAKKLIGDEKGEFAETKFPVSWKCTDASGGTQSGTATVSPEGTIDAQQQIPIGAKCSVTEGALPEAGPRYSWQPVNLEVAGGSSPSLDQTAQTISFTVAPLSEDGTGPQVTITNSLVRQDAGYYLTKTSDPVSGSKVEPGDTITYTVSVTPTGEGVTDDVVVTDDLSQVLPYADVSAIVPSQGSASISGTTLTWQLGTVSGTTPYTISYEAKVKANTWGADLKNVVSATGEQPPTDCPTCTTTTEHEVPPSYTITKSADPASGSKVKPGQVITYTVLVANNSISPISGVVVTDDMSEVLNHASFLSVTQGEGAQLGGSKLTWTVPQIEPGKSVALSYQVTVHADAWNVTIKNHITGAQGDNPPSPCPTCVTTTKHSTGDQPASPGAPVVPGQPVAPRPPLAKTGLEADRLSTWALVLLAAGALMLLGGRRRT
ncbi:DUF5979 domain-containing protein [Blastococcus sp. Marseille-P5729]|uniref:DUF5979 domain-containing protein n=1 Tax=Blastococcus sp. Marseille-P5729 TaxID=2086582 RepID=UPI00131B3BEE|nr:DUF5979 domain-containing protein [Blastococcus sp. Marseille-P5729]